MKFSLTGIPLAGVILRLFIFAIFVFVSSTASLNFICFPTTTASYPKIFSNNFPRGAVRFPAKTKVDYLVRFLTSAFISNLSTIFRISVRDTLGAIPRHPSVEYGLNLANLRQKFIVIYF